MNSYDRLNGPNPKRINRSMILLIVLGIGVAVAISLGIAGIFLPRKSIVSPYSYVNHGNVPDIGDKWLYRGRDLSNSAHSPTSKINSNNVHTLVESYKAGLGQDPSLGGTIVGAFRADINWGSVTVDEGYIFLATSNQRNEAGSVLSPTGYIMAFNRATGIRVWNKAVTSYSLDIGQFASKFEAAPAIHGDYIYIGTKNNYPQTFASPSYQTITNPTLFGFPAAGKAHRTHVYCINKHTGDEVWATEVGQVATDFGKPDNLLIFSMSPIVFDMDPTGGNNKIPVLAIGTSSGNSFIPDFSGSDETSARGYSLGADPNTRMTDIGRMLLFNGNTGAIISTTMMGPAPYTAGSQLTIDSVVYGDNSENYDMEIWHIVQPSDPELNPIIPRYSKSKMIISLTNGSIIVPGSPLVGLSVLDNTGANHIIAAGAVPINMHLVTVTMDVEFVPGTTDYYRIYPQPNPVPFITTASDLDGASGNSPARIIKQLKVGDNLTDQDAYECSEWGASVWGSNPSINFNNKGVPTELYFATGQAHKIPYDTMKRYSPPVERLFDIKQKQTDFNNDQSQINLNAVRTSNDDRLLQIKESLQVPVSTRQKSFHHNSIIAVNLRPGHIGEIMWTKKSVGYDTWRIGLLTEQERDSEFGPMPGFTDSEAHFGMLRGHDVDYAEAPYYCENCGTSGGDYILAPNKGGSFISLRLTDVNNGPTVAEEDAFILLGNPGLLGGSEYGSTLNKNTKQICTSQGNEAAAFGTAVDTTFNRRSMPPAMQWFPVNQNTPATVVPLTHRQSYLSCYNFIDKTIDYEIPYQTVPPENTYTTVTAFSSGADLIYVQPNSFTMQIRKISDGSIVHTITLDSAGVAGASIMDREIIIANGRQNFLGDNPAGTHYKAAKYVYKYSLP